MPRKSLRTRWTSSGVALAAIIAIAAIPAACKKSPTAPVLVAASNATVTANNTVTQAVSGVSFQFAGGAGAMSSAVAGQNLAVTFTGTGTTTTTAFTVTSPSGATTGTFSANTTFGSCIFAITSSTFPAGHPLALGQTVTVNPCNLNVSSAGAVANGVGTSRSVALLLGAASSAGSSVTVGVNPGGQLTLNGQTVGSVTLTPISGG
jgi:hypothetical protein